MSKSSCFKPTQGLRIRTALLAPAVSMTLIFSACSVYAQAPAATSGTSASGTSPAPPPTVFSTAANAEEVSLDLLAHDAKGHPILDLQPSQLTVTDDGTPVKISSLHLVHGDGSGRKLTLVYGRLDSAGDKNARDVSAKMLKVIPSGFSIAVMNVGSRLRLLQTFTTDRNQIQRGINYATIEDKPGVEGPNIKPEKDLISEVSSGVDSSGVAVPADDRDMAKVLLASLQESQRLSQDLFTQPQLSGLLALARAERDIPGRKVIIYFTQGFQMDSNAIDAVRSIVGAANRSGVTIYTVDLSALDMSASDGLMASLAMGAAGPGLRASAKAAQPGNGPTTQAAGEAANANPNYTPPGMMTAGADTAGRIESEGGVKDGSPLGLMAGGTGGSLIIAGDSLKKPLERMAEDMTTYYQASFVTPSADYDGRFRPVHVTASRKNVLLRYRAGYYALAPGSVSTIRPFEAPLLKILASSQLPTDLPFRSQVLRMGPLQDGNANTLVIETPINSLDVHEDSNTKLYSLHVSMVAQIKNKDGVVIDHFSEDLPRHGAIESLHGSSDDVITLQRHFVAPPGNYVLEAAILDQNTQKSGAQRINFEVPDSAPGPALSDIALVRKTDLFRVESDPSEPLRYGKAKVVPNLSGEVPKGAADVSVFFILHPDPGAAPIKLEMEVSKNGKSVGKMQLPVRSDVSGPVAVPYLSTIAANSLSPGRYDVAAILTQGGKTVQRAASFTIVGGDVASADLPRAGVKPGAPEDSETVSDSPLPGIGAREASHLVITTPTEAAPRPRPEEIATMIAGARARALHYAEALPNFSCVEVTSRSIDASGKGNWKHKDSMAELLKYRDHAESRTMLEVDGKKSKVAPEDLKGMTAQGQFGGVLNAVFDPAAKAEFDWKETDMLGAGVVQVFSFKVEQKNSNYGLTGHNDRQINAAFHGLVYIDSNTLGVRRITLETEGIPKDFSIHASSMAVDYDYVMINNHDYLMPVHAVVSVRQGKHEGVLNEFEFRDFRRFGSRVRILGFTQPPTP
ncbi:MAG TPA: VWA domain-containing protein [Acidisarcina sp.]